MRQKKYFAPLQPEKQPVSRRQLNQLKQFKKK